jgi:large subunit ribosomal protein L17
MRHRKKSEKFSRPKAQRKALVKALLRALIINEGIITTTSRAKQLRAEIDRLITLAKKDSLFHRRSAYSILGDHGLVKRLFENIGPRFKTIQGGYSRVLRVGIRKGDGASLAILELTRRQKKKVHKQKQEKEKVKTAPKEKIEKKVPKKEDKPKKGIISSVRKIFKKERDAL